MRKHDVSIDIFKYSISRNTWTALPHCPTYEHGLAELNHELVVIGGKIQHRITSEATDVVYTLKNRTWKKVLPRMSTPRCHLSVVSLKGTTIVAVGGVTSVSSVGKPLLTDAVEVYIQGRPQWYSTRALPAPSSLLSTVVIGNTCYVLGGNATPHAAFRIALSSLLGNFRSETAVSATWEQLLGNHPLICSSPVEINGKIVAVGGSVDTKLRQGTGFVSSYDFASNVWVECKSAQLPVPLYRTGVVKLDDSSAIVAGGQSKSQMFSNTFFMSTACYFAS